MNSNYLWGVRLGKVSRNFHFFTLYLLLYTLLYMFKFLKNEQVLFFSENKTTDKKKTTGSKKLLGMGYV